MITGSVKRRNSFYWLFSILFFINCSSDPAIHSPEAYTVEIKQMKFQPSELVLQKGDTVIWINHDFIVHDVTEDPGKTWTSSAIQNGESWRMVVTESSNYFCNIHQVMKGKLLVK